MHVLRCYHAHPCEDGEAPLATKPRDDSGHEVHLHLSANEP